MTRWLLSLSPAFSLSLPHSLVIPVPLTRCLSHTDSLVLPPLTHEMALSYSYSLSLIVSLALVASLSL